MSTVPRDLTDAIATGSHAAVIPAVRPNADDLVREIQSAAHQLGCRCPSSSDLSDLCRQVLGFTVEIFPGEPCIQVRNDPEIPDDLYVVFGVAATGTIDEIAAKNDDWHARVSRLPSKFSGLFRLSIAVR